MASPFGALPRLEDEDPGRLRELPLTLCGRRLAGADLSRFAAERAAESGFAGDLARFLGQWRSPEACVPVDTSGSTGAPKRLPADKRRMAQSARRTCAFLGLEPGDRILLAMPLRYIAGKMVVVRALVCGLDLVPVEPCLAPFARLDAPCALAPVTPMQAWESLADPRARDMLFASRHLLLGGGPVSAELARRLSGAPCQAWSSYGMTETLSHVALRRVNGPGASEWYEPLPGVALSRTAEGTLCISAPAVCRETLATNDLCEMDARGRFRILGRRDNVVGTGGVKVQIEAVEALLEAAMRAPFCIAGVQDPRLGEKIVLLHEEEASPAELEARARKLLPRHWVPRAFFKVEAVPRTGTGKPARKEARELAERLARAGS